MTKHKQFIIITTLIVSIAAVIFSILVEFTWTSKTTFMMFNAQKTGFSLGSSSLLGLGSSLLGGGSNESQNLISIMRSREFSEDIINKFGIIELYEIDQTDSVLAMEESVKLLIESILEVEYNEETNIITLQITTKDKYLSADMANYYLQKLERYNISKRKSKGKQTRQFLETRLDEERSKIDSISNELMIFGTENNTISLEEQTTAIISQYSDLVAQKISSEMELELAYISYGEDYPNLKGIKDRINILQNKINSLENPEYEIIDKYLIQLDIVPKLAMQYTDLLMQLEIKSNVYKYLYPEYEAAKIEEVKDLPSLEIIDRAIPAGKRTSPKRARICILSFLIAFILSAGSLIIFEIIKQIVLEEKNAKKINKIRKVLVR